MTLQLQVHDLLPVLQFSAETSFFVQSSTSTFQTVSQCEASVRIAVGKCQCGHHHLQIAINSPYWHPMWPLKTMAY